MLSDDEYDYEYLERFFEFVPKSSAIAIKGSTSSSSTIASTASGSKMQRQA
jgi:hypothetical protein